jgi:hypothetical protein
MPEVEKFGDIQTPAGFSCRLPFCFGSMQQVKIDGNVTTEYEIIPVAEVENCHGVQIEFQRYPDDLATWQGIRFLVPITESLRYKYDQRPIDGQFWSKDNNEYYFYRDANDNNRKVTWQEVWGIPDAEYDEMIANGETWADGDCS